MTASQYKAWRERMGYTHEQAAEALGVRVGTEYQLCRPTYPSGKPYVIDKRTEYACKWLELQK